MSRVAQMLVGAQHTTLEYTANKVVTRSLTLIFGTAWAVLSRTVCSSYLAPGAV